MWLMIFIGTIQRHRGDSQEESQTAESTSKREWCGPNEDVWKVGHPSEDKSCGIWPSNCPQRGEYYDIYPLD